MNADLEEKDANEEQGPENSGKHIHVFFLATIIFLATMGSQVL